MKNPISVVIRTSNSEKPLRRLLSRLKLASGDEIIVVDTGSTDGTVSLAQSAGAKIVHNRDPFHYSRTLNMGFQAAKNPWVLALSSHCVPFAEDLLQSYRSALDEMGDSVAVIYGLTLASRTAFEKLEKAPKIQKRSHSPMPGNCGNSNALYRKAAWERHPFDGAVKTGEDVEWFFWAEEAGLPTAHAPAAAVLYLHPGSPTYRFHKAWDEALVQPSAKPMSLAKLALGFAHATKHLLLRERAFRPWLGQMAHQLGVFCATRGLKRSGPGAGDKRRS